MVAAAAGVKATATVTATTSKARLKLVIAYDGHPFAGWQSQPSRQTIQDHLSAAAEAICGERLVFHGSGRTDTGVHAYGQVCHVDIPNSDSMLPEDWQRALNAHLPKTIRVLEASGTAPDFHAQKSAVGKTYRYEIYNAKVLPPHLLHRAWNISNELDDDRMFQATQILEGRHDFKRFSASRGKDSKGHSQDPVNTVRDVFSIQIQRQAERLTLDFSGSGFLYKMVRMLTGGIVLVGRRKMSCNDLTHLIEDPEGGPPCRSCAPADGLALVEVRY